MNIFGTSSSKLKPEEQVKEWKRKLAKEMRNIERDVDKLKKEEQKSLKECKKLVKEGQPNSAKILAKEIVNVRRTVDRMYATKAQLNSVIMNLQTAASMMKMQGAISKSNDIMRTMNQLINIPELKETMNTMSREMMKTGLIDEIMSDAFSSIEPDGLESDATMEVDRIVAELTAEALAPASSAPVGGIRRPANNAAVTSSEEVADEDSEELKAMQSRLQSF